jgi:hypothetical protein
MADIEDIIFEQQSTMARQAMAQIRQCSDIAACISHSVAHASPIVMQDCIIDIITPVS